MLKKTKPPSKDGQTQLRQIDVKLTTSSLWISVESFDAFAVADMVERSSKGVRAARVPDARVGAGQVANLAILGRVTVWIHATFGN